MTKKNKAVKYKNREDLINVIRMWKQEVVHLKEKKNPEMIKSLYNKVTNLKHCNFTFLLF